MGGRPRSRRPAGKLEEGLPAGAGPADPTLRRASQALGRHGARRLVSLQRHRGGGQEGEPLPLLAEAHLWAEGLSRRLVDLHDKLSHHFREEETSGLFKELRRTFPWADGQTREIEGQHRTLMRELRAILPEALRFAEAREGAGPGLRRRTVGLLDQLNEHEAAENELIHRLHLEDIGLGD